MRADGGPDSGPDSGARADTAHHRRVTDLFLDALDCAPDARASFLARACRDAADAPDAALRAEVEALLAAHDAADDTGRLDTPVLTRPLPPVGPGAGARLGRWELLDELGSGGMGVVWRARRADGVYQREVAVKLLPPGPPGSERVRRLEAERQILARLEHPHIARLLDGGVTEDGLPFLVMELIRGEPLTDYARAHALGLDARLGLFLQVCEAVGHAHRRLVIHRDLKPSNVLVAETDGSPDVRLLDFGIARLVEREGDTLTRTGPGPMTPQYAAPEQIRGGEVTTAADVYALGLLLYELLADRRPYDLAGRSPAEVEHVVCEAEPPRPSAAAPPGRQRALRGDLDTIALKALAKEPERRYASADALADDLRRHRAGMPVEARPATAGYRVRRFVRRHRAASAAAAVALLAVLLGAGLALWQARAADRERLKAVEVNRFLQEMLASADPNAGGARDVTVAEVLDAAAARAGAELARTPEVEAAVRTTLGATYRSLGRYDAAERQLRRALALRQRLHGPAHAATAESLDELGRLAFQRADWGRADTLLRRGLAVRQRLGAPAPVAASLIHLAQLDQTLDRPDTAEARYRRALALLRRTPGANAADALVPLGTLLYEQGRADAADSLLTDAARLIRARSGGGHPTLATVLNTLAWVHDDLGRHADVLPLLEESLAIRRAAFGEEHPEVALSLNDLGYYFWALGDAPRADSLYRRALALYDRAFDGRHPDIPSILLNIGVIQREQGRFDEAAALLERSLALRREILGPDHPDLAYDLNNLARVEAARGRQDRAEALLREGLALRRARLPADHHDTATSLYALGRLVEERGRLAEAERLIREAIAVSGRAIGPDHVETIWFEVGLADLLTDARRFAEAERLLVRALPAHEAAYGPDGRWTRVVVQTLADLYDARGDPAAAAPFHARLAAASPEVSS